MCHKYSLFSFSPSKMWPCIMLTHFSLPPAPITLYFDNLSLIKKKKSYMAFEQLVHVCHVSLERYINFGSSIVLVLYSYTEQTIDHLMNVLLQHNVDYGWLGNRGKSSQWNKVWCSTVDFNNQKVSFLSVRTVDFNLWSSRLLWVCDLFIKTHST